MSKNEIHGLDKLDKGIWRRNEERGCLEMDITRLMHHAQNPRDEAEFEENNKSLAVLKQSIASTKFGGIHDPIKVYIDEFGRPVILEGHRRKEAMQQLFDEILQDPNATEEMKDRYRWIPVVVDTPKNEVEALVHMLTSDAAKKHWSFPEQAKFTANLLDAANGNNISHEDEELIRALGWNDDRFHVMVEIAKSPTLMNAIRTYTSCTYKGWRAVVVLAKALVSKRPGLLGTDKERIYKKLVRKVEYYTNNAHKTKDGRTKAQAGSLMERVHPVINYDGFPTKQVNAWLNNDVDICPGSPERETDGPQRREIVQAYLNGRSPKPKPKSKAKETVLPTLMPNKRIQKSFLQTQAKTEDSVAVATKTGVKANITSFDDFKTLVGEISNNMKSDFTKKQRRIFELVEGALSV